MNARKRFERIRAAVIELATVQALIATGGDDWQPDSVGHIQCPDPTAAQAIRNVDEWGVRLAELRTRESELFEIIGDGLREIESVRVGLSDAHADVLDQRYIDCLRWHDVELHGKRIKLSTGKLLASEAFAWLDAQDSAKLRESDRNI